MRAYYFNFFFILLSPSFTHNPLECTSICFVQFFFWFAIFTKFGGDNSLMGVVQIYPAILSFTLLIFLIITIFSFVSTWGLHTNHFPLLGQLVAIFSGLWRLNHLGSSTGACLIVTNEQTLGVGVCVLSAAMFAICNQSHYSPLYTFITSTNWHRNLRKSARWI